MSFEDQHNDENTPPTDPNPLYSEAMPYGVTPPPAMYSHYAPPPPPPGAVPPPAVPPPARYPPPSMVAPPPPMAAPPVIFRWPLLFVFLLIGVGVIVESLLVRGGNTLLLFISQMVLLTAAICFTPTIANWFTLRRNRVVRVAVESVLFAVLFLGFGLWLFGRPATGIWIAYALALIVLVEVGSHLVAWQKDRTLKRLATGISYKSIRAEAESIEKFARHEVVLYVPVPFGFILGMIVGLIRQQAPLSIIVFCFQLVLSSMSIVLLYFLLVGFWRMCDPLFKTSPVAVPELVVKKSKRAFNQQTMKEDAEQKYIDLACDVSELRKIYKYDSLHNTILLVIFVAVVVRTTGVSVDIKLLVGGVLMATLLFSEVPYGIGQYLLHQRVLEQYTGTRHVEMAKKLTEYAPAFLPLPFVGSLITTGTIGPALYILFDQFARDVWSSFIK